MRRRIAPWAAWAIVGVTLALHVFSTTLVALGWHVETPADADLNAGAAGFVVAFIAFPLVGATIVTRRPGNAVGWLFLLIGLNLAVSDVAVSYADYAVYANPGALPAPNWVGWLGGWADPLFFMSVALVLALFPDGRALSQRWRPVLWLTLTAGMLAVSWNALKPGPIFEDTMPIENPAGIAWLEANLGFVDQVVFLSFGAGILLCGSSAVVRYRRSRGDDRDRMKWLASAAVLLVVGFVAGVVLAAVGLQQLGQSLIGLGFAMVPVAVGVGVLRYRLYDIDRVISRTLTFAVVTFALGVVYVALVLFGQLVFSSLAGGGGGPVIAISTLVVAALFLPMRKRIQRIVDRRFNRRRYDSQRTLEAFGARLRQQVELETLAGDLRRAVDETMQPAHVSLWLRGAPR